MVPTKALPIHFPSIILSFLIVSFHGVTTFFGQQMRNPEMIYENFLFLPHTSDCRLAKFPNKFASRELALLRMKLARPAHVIFGHARGVRIPYQLADNVLFIAAGNNRNGK